MGVMKGWVKKVCCAVIVVAVLWGPFFVLSAVLKGVFLERQLNNIESESDSIPAYVVFGELHLGDERINISQLCRKQSEDYLLREIFCVTDDKVYFVYSDATQNTRTWSIATIDIKTKVFANCCQFADAQEHYTVDLHGVYKERNGFFCDGKIILSDFDSVLAYDIDSGQVSMYDYDTYVFPQRTIYGECTGEKTINLHINDSIQSFTLQEMAEKSSGISKLYEMKDKKTWNELSYLTPFFTQNSIQVIGGEIFAIESVINYSGSSIAVILQYDQEKNSWLYVTHCYAGDTIRNKCYIVHWDR